MKLLLFSLALVLFVCGEGYAAVRVWTGAGTTANWSEAANWQSNTVPVNFDDLVFPQVAKRTVTNTLAAGTYVDSITITGTNFVFTGNAINLLGSLTNTAPSNTFLIPLTLIGGTNYIYSSDLNGRPFTISGNITLQGIGYTNIHFIGGNINLAGNFGGSTYQGIDCLSGVLYLSGTNSYLNGTAIYPQATLRAGSSNALGLDFSLVEILSDSTNGCGHLELTNDITIAQPLYFESMVTNAAQFSPQVLSMGSNTITGPIFVTNANPQFPGLVNVCVSNGSLTITNTISGTSGIAKFGSGQLTLSGSNSFSGLTSVREGVLACSATSTSFRPIPADVIVYSTLRTITTVKMNDGYTLTDYGILDLAGRTAIIPMLNGNGTITLGNGFLEPGSDLGNGNFSGNIVGPGSIVKFGSGIQTFSGFNTHTNMIIAGGTVVVDGIQTNSPIRIDGGTLVGNGYCGSVTTRTTSSRIGTLTPWGNLHIVGNLVLSNATFSTGITSANSLGQVNVSGNITLTNATLLVTNSYFPPAGGVFTLIKNSGGFSITGNFTNSPEGSTIAKLVPFQLSYFGNAANDITLTHVQPSAMFATFAATGTNTQLTGAGISNATYSLEASTNLLDWTELSMITAPKTTFSFTNPVSTLPLRFFRIKTL